MIINNVKLVLEDETIDGSLEVQEGRIYAFAESQSRLPGALDGEGGWLLPGLIELHTDNLDKFFTPRPKVDWPAHSAMSSHDALMVASGITTVLDAVAIGDVRDGGDRLENLEKMINAVEETQKRGLNRAEHRLHLRCELPHHTTLPLFEKLVDREPVTLVSLMDHSPGQRQFANREKYREYYQGKYQLSGEQMQRFEEEQMALAAAWSQPNRQAIAAMCRERQIALASHDDARTCRRIPPAWQRDCRISHHVGRRAGFAPARNECVDGGAEYRARRLAFRQCRRASTGRQRPVGYSLFRLLPRQPA